MNCSPVPDLSGGSTWIACDTYAAVIAAPAEIENRCWTGYMDVNGVLETDSNHQSYVKFPYLQSPLNDSRTPLNRQDIMYLTLRSF